MFVLMNPNCSRSTTIAMVEIAGRILPGLVGWTAPSGPALLETMDGLRASADMVARAILPQGTRGAIVSAFGDPGRAALAARLAIPVVGIGQAAARAASSGGRRFAVATHTPGLVDAIDTLMRSATEKGEYLGTFLAEGEASVLSADPVRLDSALLAAVARANRSGAEAVIIGGGPLGQAAERLRPHAPCPLIAPIPEAARLLLELVGTTR